MITTRMKICILAALTLYFAFAGASWGRANERTAEFNIPAQSLDTALIAFAKQADVQISVAAKSIMGMKTEGVVGRFTPSAALARLLTQTGLEFSTVGDRTFSVALPSRQTTTSLDARAITPLVGVMTMPADQGAGVAAPVPASASANGRQERANSPSLIDEVVVTGTQIRGANVTGSDLITLDRDQIDEMGYATTAEIVRALPQNFPGSQTETAAVVSTASSNTTFGSSVNLRGLGADATLTLLNGRRLAPAGLSTFVDVSTIPLTAIERIEIVPDGASATYGSDAVGGVVNFILKRAYEGAESSLRYGAVSEGESDEMQFGQTLGTNWATGDVILTYEYYKRDSLAAAEREFSANSDLQALGGSNFSSLQSNPGNITRLGTTNVRIAVPPGQDGTSVSEAEFLPGQSNFQNTREATDLLPRQERHSAFLSARQGIGERVNLFADLLWSKRDFELRDNPQGATLLIPESNAYRQMSNLFLGRGNMRMTYSFLDDLGPQIVGGETSGLSAVLGTSVQVSGAWALDVFATLSELNEDTLTTNRPNTSLLAPALASSDPATAFNPFADGSNTPASVLALLVGSNDTRVDANIWGIEAKLTGTLRSLPAGDLRLAVGANSQDEWFAFYSTDYNAAGIGQDVAGGIRPGERRSWASFAELYWPVFGENNKRAGLNLLDFSLSARYQDYDDVGSTTNPKMGVRWSPWDGITFRGSVGTSFKAPFLSDTNRPSAGAAIPVSAAVDPEATGGSTQTFLMVGGNPDLEPEEADTWTAGIQFNPAALPQLSVAVGYFNVDFDKRIVAPDNIGRVFAQSEAFEGVLIRNPTQAQVDAAVATVDSVSGPLPPPGTIEAILDARRMNLSSLEVDGFDLEVEYGFDTSFGAFDLSVNGSYLLHFDEHFTPTSDPADRLDTIGRPVDLRIRGGISWRQGGFGASAFINYADSYVDDISVPARKIDSSETMDLQLRYGRDQERGNWLDGTVLRLSVINLFDSAPPFVNGNTGFGFDPTNAISLGRSIAVDVAHHW